MGAILQDLKFGLRMLAKNPGFTAIAVITLALGIGANTAIFSLVNAILLRPLPYPQANRLVMIWETEPSGPGDLYPATGPDFVDWKARNGVFESIAAGTGTGASLMGTSEPLELNGLEVSPEMFHVLGVQPLAGRTFAQDETQPGHNHVVILSYGLWQRAFGGDPSVVRRKITMDGEAYDVAGIMPRDFKFPHIWGRQPEFWTPLTLQQPKWRQSRGNHWIFVIGRLKKGVPLEKARADMETLSQRLAHQYPDTNTGVIAKVVSLRDQLVKQVKPALLVLFAAVAFLLLIACVNVANLLLAKAVGRQREIAIRLAVGSGRARLIRQLLTESVLLFSLGGVAGLVVGWSALKMLLHTAPTGYVPGMMQVHLDGWVFLFTFLIAFVAGALAGLFPALQASKPDLQESLKESSRSVASPHHRSRSVLTAAEMALALMMLIGAGLAIKSLVRLLGVQAGFDPHHVLTARLSLPDARYPKAAQTTSFYRQLLERVRALPGVTSAAVASELPLQGGSNGVVYIEGQPIPKDMWSSPLVEWCSVTPRYFLTLRIPVLKGRDFTLQDVEKSPKVAIINQTMARRFWPNQDAVGKRFSQGYEHPDWITVVGVVGDVREFGLNHPPIPEAYYPEYQNGDSRMALVIRSATTPLSQISAVRGAIHGLDPQLPVYRPRTLDRIVSESSAQQRFVALLLGLFAGLALVLASVGIYGVIAYSVAQRTHEFGVRMALGAQGQDILRMVVAEGLRLALAGVAVGLVGAWALTRFLTSLLFGVKPTDPGTFAAVSLVLISVALFACYIPARRAMKVDPLIALRYE
ncbi:MAG: ABC transporter permease [Terriglobia bacterium]